MRTPWPCLALSILFSLLATAPARADVAVQGGIGFVAVTGAAPGTELTLENRRGKQVGIGTTDSFGSLIFRELTPGGGYVVRDATSGTSAQVTVLSFDDTPDPSLYQRQSLTGGFQYIEMRDGTLLAATVRPPLGRTMADGPFPTLVEYSGYATADPDNPQPVSLLASALGYATVGVNMRGSGCSGGVFDLFDLPTTADGYDVIEAVAAQPWVQNGKVGLIGISFSGITQLFVGGARPPHLLAMAPLSVIADIYRSPGFPGGIFNNGFAGTWLQDRANDARPAPQGGQPYAIDRVNAGDQTCLANQRLRLQTQDPVQQTETYPFYTPSVMDNRSPINWVHRIEVPTFLADSWQDEQTGGDFASMLFRFPRRPDVKFNLQNGVHASPLEPDVLYNWIAFLDLYVAGKVPDPGRVVPIAPFIYPQILGPGAPLPPLPADRFDGITDYSQARALFESDPARARLHGERRRLTDPGTSGADLRARVPPLAGARRAPVRVVHGRRRHPRAVAGRATAAIDGFHPDPDARPAQTLPGVGQDDSWVIMPPYDWRPYPTRHGRGLRDAAAGRGRDHRRSRQRRSLAALERRGHRSPGDAHRDPARRPGDLRPERLAARQHAAPRQQALVEARSASDVPRARRRPAAPGEVLQGSHRPVPGRPRLPRGLAHPHQRRGSRRRPHALDVRTPPRRTGPSWTRSRARGAGRRAWCWESSPTWCLLRPCPRARGCAGSPAGPTFPPRTGARMPPAGRVVVTV